jgi:hypothetical protein
VKSGEFGPVTAGIPSAALSAKTDAAAGTTASRSSNGGTAASWC